MKVRIGPAPGRGGEDGQRDGREDAGQGFREGAGAGASSHGGGPVGVESYTL
ncbi:MAG: hypothetical protein WAW42_08540 [Candidatus Competibacteraceae bacterium]